MLDRLRRYIRHQPWRNPTAGAFNVVSLARRNMGYRGCTYPGVYFQPDASLCWDLVELTSQIRCLTTQSGTDLLFKRTLQGILNSVDCMLSNDYLRRGFYYSYRLLVCFLCCMSYCTNTESGEFLTRRNKSLSKSDKVWALEQIVRLARESGVCRNLGGNLYFYCVKQDSSDST